jgi:hypothetical protein
LIALGRASLHLLVFNIGSPNEFVLVRLLLLIILFLRCQLFIKWDSCLGLH